MNNSFNVRRSVSCAAILTIVAWLHLLLNVPMISQIYQRTENGVFVRIDSTIVGLQVCNEKILHITVTPVPQPPQHEKLVVTRTWEPCHW
ncbi:MAG TPA: hypothetical protein VI758_13635, partial [Bacteroidota bacterium]